jgi:hypothetical protein
LPVPGFLNRYEIQHARKRQGDEPDAEDPAFHPEPVAGKKKDQGRAQEKVNYRDDDFPRRYAVVFLSHDKTSGEADRMLRRGFKK